MRIAIVVILSLVLSSYAQDYDLPDYGPLPVPKPEFADYKLALNAIFTMGIRLQYFLANDQSENFLVSPINAVVAIGELMLGSEGRFRRELADLLSLPYSLEKITVNNTNKNTSLHFSYATLHLQMRGLLKALDTQNVKDFVLQQNSALFHNEKLKLKNEFSENLQMMYLSKLYPMDFDKKAEESQKFINTWAVNNTNGLIKTILPGVPSSRTAAIFANAIYFKAKWRTPFAEELNKINVFNVKKNHQVNVTYMLNFIEQIFYVEREEYRMIGLPYKNDELGMYIILPKPESKNAFEIKNFTRSLKPSEVLEAITQGTRKDVVLKIPKMTVSNSFSVLDQLKKYRLYKKETRRVRSKVSANVADIIKNRVDDFANFTSGRIPMGGDIFLRNAVEGVLHVDDIVQQMVISINEEGTEAAALAASTVDYMGGSKTVVLDRPFTFFIRHEATSATLFWATISNPSV